MEYVLLMVVSALIVALGVSVLAGANSDKLVQVGDELLAGNFEAGVTATDIGGGVVRVAWDDYTGDRTFIVQRSITANGPWTEVVELPDATGEIEDNSIDLADGGPFYYRILVDGTDLISEVALVDVTPVEITLAAEPVGTNAVLNYVDIGAPQYQIFRTRNLTGQTTLIDTVAGDTINVKNDGYPTFADTLMGVEVAYAIDTDIYTDTGVGGNPDAYTYQVIGYYGANDPRNVTSNIANVIFYSDETGTIVENAYNVLEANTATLTVFDPGMDDRFLWYTNVSTDISHATSGGYYNLHVIDRDTGQKSILQASPTSSGKLGSEGRQTVAGDYALTIRYHPTLGSSYMTFKVWKYNSTTKTWAIHFDHYAVAPTEQIGYTTRINIDQYGWLTIGNYVADSSNYVATKQLIVTSSSAMNYEFDPYEVRKDPISGQVSFPGSPRATSTTPYFNNTYTKSGVATGTPFGTSITDGVNAAVDVVWDDTLNRIYFKHFHKYGTARTPTGFAISTLDRGTNTYTTAIQYKIASDTGNPYPAFNGDSDVVSDASNGWLVYRFGSSWLYVKDTRTADVGKGSLLHTLPSYSSAGIGVYRGACLHTEMVGIKRVGYVLYSTGGVTYYATFTAQ